MAKTIIRVANPDLHDNQGTTLTSDTNIGATSLPITSSSGFKAIAWASDYYYVIIGNYGEQTSEITLVSAKTDTTFTCSALRFSHSASDPVTLIGWNQIKVYGRLITWGADIFITGSTTDIDCSQQFTTYEYTTTPAVYGIFTTTYYRSATVAEESDISDEIAVWTFTFKSAKKIIEAGLRKALTKADENPDASLGWNTLTDLMNEGLNEIITHKKRWQCLHKVDNSINTATWVAYVDKPLDLSVLEFISITGTKINYISKLRYNQLTSSTQGVITWKPYLYTIKNDKVYFYPTPNSIENVVYEYYSMPAEITSLSTEVKKEFATILVYFMAAQAAYIRNNEKRGALMDKKYNEILMSQIEDVTGEEQVGDAEEVERTSIYWIDDDNLY